MQADKDCVRSYRPEIESSNVNSLSLILKTTSRENLLFYLGRNSTVLHLFSFFFIHTTRDTCSKSTKHVQYMVINAPHGIVINVTACSFFIC